MNDHTARLLKRQLISLDEYEQGIISIKRMLYGLHAALGAIEEKFPDAYYHAFYNFDGMLDLLTYDGKLSEEEIKSDAKPYRDELRNSIQTLLAENGYKDEDIRIA